jgi:N-methylhydantoinase A
MIAGRSDRNANADATARESAVGVTVGVDIGGTFADFVALDTEDGRAVTLKVLTTPTAPGQDVAAGLRRLAGNGLDLSAVGRFVHGTTVGVNTIIQRRGARIALFTTAGFTDLLELARLRMPNPYSLFCERPPRWSPASACSPSRSA